MLLAMPAAYALRYGLALHSSRADLLIAFLPLTTASLLLWSMLFPRMKLDGFCLGWHLPATVSQLLIASVAILGTVMAMSYLTGHYVSRLVLAFWGLLIFGGFVIIRRIALAILRSSYLTKAIRRVVIVGNGPLAREMAFKLQRHPEMLCQVVGHLYLADASLNNHILDAGEEAIRVQTLGVADLLRVQRVDEVIITLSKPGNPEVMNLAAQCRKNGIVVSVVPGPYELYLSTPQLLDIGGLPILRLQQADSSFANGTAKRVFDVVLTCIVIPLSLPFVLVAALVFLTKRQPFVRELRCGRSGKPFWMYRLNSDRNGPSLPLFEQLLHQVSITELPQLWNVLRGDMSLVGPRPEVLERVKHYSEWQRQRLNVRPGITGLAQVHGLREEHSSEEKARFDLQYMLHASPFLDLSLLLQTAWTLVTRLLQINHLEKLHVNAGELRKQDAFQEPFPNAHSPQSSTN
jgi:lipopolysaccharide/colanic/teichoic acid biosynthesis glycosyltransferase